MKTTNQTIHIEPGDTVTVVYPNKAQVNLFVDGPGAMIVSRDDSERKFYIGKDAVLHESELQ